MITSSCLQTNLLSHYVAFRRNAKAKKEGKPLPGPSTGRRGRPPRALATDNETTVVEDDEDGTNEAQDAMVPEVEIQYKSNGLLKKAASADEESSDEEDDVNVRRIADDKDGDDEGAESPIEDDDIEEDEEEEDEEQEEEDDIDDADDADPRDFEDEMGQGLDDKRLHEGNEDMDD